jgi:hypothetical protein
MILQRTPQESTPCTASVARHGRPKRVRTEGAAHRHFSQRLQRAGHVEQAGVCAAQPSHPPLADSPQGLATRLLATLASRVHGEVERGVAQPTPPKSASGGRRLDGRMRRARGHTVLAEVSAEGVRQVRGAHAPRCGAEAAGAGWNVALRMRTDPSQRSSGR